MSLPFPIKRPYQLASLSSSPLCPLMVRKSRLSFKNSINNWTLFCLRWMPRSSLSVLCLFFCFVLFCLVNITFHLQHHISHCCSVAQTCLTMQHQGWQDTRLPCLSPFPGACSNSCSLSCDATQLSQPLSFPSPMTSIFPSIRVFSNELAFNIR